MSPSTLGMVAVHGTGTPLGDPIEIAALSTAAAGPSGGPCAVLRLGAIKSCFGHTEGAAGLTGALLAMQSLRHQVPAHCF